MKDLIDDIMKEYKKDGHMNIYVVGQEGSGKTILSQQILDGVCEKLNIKTEIKMIDFNNNISSTNGINLIETFNDSDDYKFKIKVLMKQNAEGILRRGHFRYNFGKANIQRFQNRGVFDEEYERKKQEVMKTYYSHE